MGGDDGLDWNPDDVLEEICEQVRLTDSDRTLLQAALAEDPGLRGDLGFLLAHLHANLSGVFLRAFVRYLRTPAPGLTNGPADALTPALADAIASIPRPSLRGTGS